MKKLLWAFAILPFALLGCQGGSSSDPVTPSGTTGTTSTTSTASSEDVGAAGARGATFASIQPILQTNCVQCHGENEPKEGVQLTSYESVMKGGEHGPIVQPGDPENSLLVQVLRGSHGKPKMPPKSEGLPDAEIAKVEAWIKDGAKA